MKIGGGRTSGSEGRCLNHQNAIKQWAKLPIKLKYPQIKVPKMQRSNTKPPFSKEQETYSTLLRCFGGLPMGAS
jgi:hypothetical protein